MAGAATSDSIGRSSAAETPTCGYDAAESVLGRNVQRLASDAASYVTGEIVNVNGGGSFGI